MKIMNKALMIISLMSSVMSCKLYEKLLDVTEESLDKKEVSMESHGKPEADVITDIEDRDRSGRKSRSLNDDNANEARESRAVVSPSDDDLLNRDQNAMRKQFDKYYKEAEDINIRAKGQLIEVDRIEKELKEVNTKLDEMSSVIIEANFALQKARSSENNQYKKQSLKHLHNAIEKVKNSTRVVKIMNYDEASDALKSAKSGFSLAKIESDKFLEAIRSDSPNLWYHFLNEAKASLIRAENMLEVVKNCQTYLKSEMSQVEKDFSELMQVYKVKAIEEK
ncbi:hypothetical protein DB313_06000 (plasmid) [Borrelia turcica IST7]|uniref:Lipoprotein n=1 Tax=Borrelia turcica IST7 TaxID=1104446 RepID=A0A386PNM1_9SPIR|nr:hypothetical protein [Borrelia turcica]AYE37054.1 hypothetical protein DB313_06000 [Borrelia turcica IST7]